MLWDTVVHQGIIGKDIQFTQNNRTYRAPIGSVDTRGGHVLISSPWVAVYKNDKWIKTTHRNPLCEITKTLSPTEDNSGNIHFPMPALGEGVIFRDEKLDEKNVEGLGDA